MFKIGQNTLNKWKLGIIILRIGSRKLKFCIFWGFFIIFFILNLLLVISFLKFGNKGISWLFYPNSMISYNIFMIQHFKNSYFFKAFMLMDNLLSTYRHVNFFYCIHLIFYFMDSFVNLTESSFSYNLSIFKYSLKAASFKRFKFEMRIFFLQFLIF